METLQSTKTDEPNKNRKTFSLETKLEAVKAYKKGESVASIAKRIDSKGINIYQWVAQHRANPKIFINKVKNKNREKLVTKVVEDIRAGKTGEHSRSLVEDFGFNQEASNNSNVELKFCPCCGTNIKAVQIALETCQEIKG